MVVTCAIRWETRASLEYGPSCVARESGKLTRIRVGQRFEAFQEELQRP